MEIQTIATATYHCLLRRLDYCPTWLALPVGIGAGVLGAVGALTWTPAVVGAALFVLLLGGAALLAWSGEPVARLPETITIDGSDANEAAIKRYNEEHGTAIAIRQVQYVNNVVEQDQRAVKRVTRPMLGFKSFEAA